MSRAMEMTGLPTAAGQKERELLSPVLQSMRLYLEGSGEAVEKDRLPSKLVHNKMFPGSQVSL